MKTDEKELERALEQVDKINERIQRKKGSGNSLKRVQTDLFQDNRREEEIIWKYRGSGPGEKVPKDQMKEKMDQEDAEELELVTFLHLGGRQVIHLWWPPSGRAEP